MAKSSWFIFLFFILGIITANLLGKDWFMTYGGLDQYVLSEIGMQEISYDKYFLYVCWQRIRLVIVMLILAKLVRKNILVYVCLCLLTFSFGFLLSMAVLESGIIGILIISGAVFPQVLPYMAAFYLWQKLMISGSQKVTYKYHSKRTIKQKMPMIGYYLIIFLLVICGIILESYVNPFILRKIILL